MADLQQKLETIRREEVEKETEALAQKLGLPYLDLTLRPIDIEALGLIPENQARESQAACIQKEGLSLILAAAAPQSAETKKIIKELEDKGFRTNIYLVSLESLNKAWEEYKKVRPKTREKISGLVTIPQEKLTSLQEKIRTFDDLTRAIKETSAGEISELLEIILVGALQNDASDIHFEKEEKESRLRFRLDGLLYDILNIRNEAHNFLLSRTKLLSELKLNVHDRAQDGRFSILWGKNEIEIRVSILPSEYGESIVMRILNPKSLVSIPDLGLRKDLEEILNAELAKPNGMILVTGPTGSGKTTTLYAFLRKLSSPKIKIITVEDPIEYHLEGIDQTQIKPEKGYTFASALRSVLRQDPDVILVGEIRDKETADIATQASLTGHLVFSTLHTNEAVGTIPRLINLGIKAPMIGPALNLAIAQRLLRKICKNCAESFRPDPLALNKIKKGLTNLPKALKPSLANIKLRKAVGCGKCNKTGYKGRVGIFEFFLIDKTAEKFISRSPSSAELFDFALNQGMVAMQQDGLLKVLGGETTLEELERVTGKI